MLKTDVKAGHKHVVCIPPPPGSGVTWSCLTQHSILSPFLCEHLSRSLSSSRQLVSQQPNLRIRLSFQFAVYYQMYLFPQRMPCCWDRQLSLLSRGAQQGKPRVHDKEAVAGLQTSGEPHIGCTVLMTAEYDYRPQNITQTRLYMPTLCPPRGRTCMSSCQPVSSANNKLFACTQYLSSLLSRLLR